MAGIRRGARGVIAVAVLCAVPWLARGAEAGPPEPELRVVIDEPELAPDALPPGDPRRGAILVRSAVRRHADAVDALVQEQVAFEVALARWRDASARGSAQERPCRSTPRADALRAQVVSFALRALDEASTVPELPDALIVGAIDADRLGRPRDALRLLGTLIRRHPASPHAGDAWLALGEHHLRNGDLTRARVAFDEAERRGRPAVREWAASRGRELQVRVLEGPASAAVPRG